MKDIEELKAIARKINMKELREEIELKWVSTKINNHLKRNPHLNLTTEEIKGLILKDDLVASFFAKDPSRQNFTEKIISEIIVKIEGVENFQNLPSSTKWYLIDGEVKHLISRPVGVKNIDYLFEFNGQSFVANQKYTKEMGGAQDNQFNDVVSFLQHSIGLKDKVAVAIVDGAYYNEVKINQLKEINPKAIVISGFELEGKLSEYR